MLASRVESCSECKSVCTSEQVALSRCKNYMGKYWLAEGEALDGVGGLGSEPNQGPG